MSEPDRIADRYSVVGPLGEGGMGRVLLAEDAWRGGRRVALKAATADDAEARAALQREFGLLRRLRHPSVVSVLDFGTCRATRLTYFTMENVEGVPLPAAARERPASDVAALLVELCRVLDFLDSRGVVHGDLKGDNVLVRGGSPGSAVTLVDFGLSLASGEGRLGAGFSGTLTHAAPEVLAGGRPDHRSDLYALGVIAFEALVGRPPFAPADPAGLARAHRETAPPLLAAERTDLPRGACTVLDRLLAKNPAERPESAAAVAAALTRSFPGVPDEDVEALVAHARAPRLPGQAAAAPVCDEMLARLLAPQREGRRSLLVVGRAGSGRRRLLDDLRARAQLNGAIVISGRAGEAPYSGLMEPIHEVVRHLGAGSSIVAENLPELSKIAPDLIAGTSVTPSPPLPRDDERLRLARTLWLVIGALAVRPVLLCLEDADRLDGESRWILAHVVRNLDLAFERGHLLPLTVVATAAGEDDRGGPGSEGAAGEGSSSLARAFARHGDVVKLEAVDESGLASMLAAMFPRLAGATWLASAVHRAVGGRPALAEAWCEGLIRRGALRREGAAWILDRDHAALRSMTGDIADAVAVDIADLPAMAGRLLAALALLPAGVSQATLGVLVGEAPAAVAFGLDVLETRGLVTAPFSARDRSVALASAAVATAARRQLASELPALAARLLDRAKTPSALLGDDARAVLAETAGQMEEAVACLVAALAESRERRDVARSAVLAERLARLSRGAGRRRALRRLAEALAELDRLSEASVAAGAARAESTCDGVDDAEDSIDQAVVEARIAVREGRFAAAAEGFAHALDQVALREAGVPATRVLVPRHAPEAIQLERIRALSAAGETTAADEALARLAASATDEGALLDVSLAAGAHELRNQRTASAVATLSAALPLARLLERTLDEASCENNLGVAEIRAGDLAPAAGHLARALTLRRAVGARRALAGTLSNLALLELERGRPQAAARHARACLAIKREVGDLHGELLARINLAAADVEREDAVAARAGAAAAAALLCETVDESSACAVDVIRGEIDLLLGDVPAARRRAQEALARATAAVLERQAHAARTLAVSVLLVGGDAEGASARARELLSASMLNLRETTDLDLLLAEALCRSDDTWWQLDWSMTPRTPLPDPVAAEARRHADRALAAGERLGPRVLLRARLVRSALLAQHAPGDPASLASLSEELAAARCLLPSIVAPSLRLRVLAAQAWVATRRGDFDSAERALVAAIAVVRRWLRRIPAEHRAEFLADSRRRAVRDALLWVRRRRLDTMGAGAWFSVVDGGRASGSSDAPRPTDRALARARRETSRLREVLDISRGINALVPVDELLDRVLESAMRFTHAERGFIVLGPPESLRFAASRDRAGRSVPQAEFAISRSVLVEVVRTKEPVLCSDARTDARFTAKASVLALDLRSVLVAPLVTREAVMGAVYVDNSEASGVFGEEDRDLLALFATQAAVAVENARLHATRLEKERLDQELSIARNIQQGLLPRALPGPAAFLVAAAMEPARDVGGDYYDFIETAAGSLRVAVGDVSGKGVPAGLFMVMARTILRSVAATEGRLDDVLVRVNDVLAPQIEDDKFMSLVLIELAPDGRSVRYCLAGHDPPLLYRVQERRVDVLEAGGLVLGAFPDVRGRLEERSLSVEPGDVLVCYSDGVTECRAPNGDLYGRERLIAALAASAPAGAQAVLAGVRGDLDAFRAGAERSDDVTLVVLQVRHGAGDAGRPPAETPGQP